MTNRIAPSEGISRHFDAITYLNELSIQWKLRAAGEPHTLTLELIGQWRQHRREIAECRRADLNEHWLMGYKVKLWHPKAVQIIDEIVLNLEAEYGWPAPLKPLVTEHDIDRLREAIRELDACKQDAEVKY